MVDVGEREGSNRGSLPPDAGELTGLLSRESGQGLAKDVCSDLRIAFIITIRD